MPSPALSMPELQAVHLHFNKLYLCDNVTFKEWFVSLFYAICLIQGQ